MNLNKNEVFILFEKEDIKIVEVYFELNLR